MKTVLKVLGIATGSLVLLFAGLVLYFNLVRVVDISRQKAHLNALALRYSEPYTPVDEQSFVAFDPAAGDLRLNEIQLLASHNSYKKKGPAVARWIIALADSPEEAEALKYGYRPLTEQLDQGVRSFELDLRFRKGQFEVIHVPLVDNSSTVPRFAPGLEEIRLWSDHNPGHIPIMILLELKDDWMMLDPALRDIGAAELALLDRLLRDTFGERLFTPGGLPGGHATLNETVTGEGWPPLRELLGHIIFILHPGKYTGPYLAMHTDFRTMAMFPAASDSDVENGYAAFVVHNEPDVAAVQALVKRNYIVRTRLDSNLVRSDDRFARGLASGAQILTTDFGPGHGVSGSIEPATLDGPYLVIVNGFLR